MTLRNAFDGLATERGLWRIANLLQFARDPNDRLRVIIDNTVPASVFSGNANQSIVGNNYAPYGSGTWSLQDARETQRVQMYGNSAFVKKNRWTF